MHTFMGANRRQVMIRKIYVFGIYEKLFTDSYIALVM
jgi:hypothetical protein